MVEKEIEVPRVISITRVHNDDQINAFGARRNRRLKIKKRKFKIVKL